MFVLLPFFGHSVLTFAVYPAQKHKFEYKKWYKWYYNTCFIPCLVKGHGQKRKYFQKDVWSMFGVLISINACCVDFCPHISDITSALGLRLPVEITEYMLTTRSNRQVDCQGYISDGNHNSQAKTDPLAHEHSRRRSSCYISLHNIAFTESDVRGCADN